jgi:integrase
LEIGRIPVEDARAIVVLEAELERRLLEACDDWQFPLFLTLLLTGLRPGELTHLLLPDDLDLDGGWLDVRNKPRLGWQVKTRSERQLRLVPALVTVLKHVLAGRTTGPVFRQRRCGNGQGLPLADSTANSLEQELSRRVARRAAESPEEPARLQFIAVAEKVWRDAGALRDEWIRLEFIRILRALGHAEITDQASA